MDIVTDPMSLLVLSGGLAITAAKVALWLKRRARSFPVMRRKFFGLAPGKLGEEYPHAGRGIWAGGMEIGSARGTVLVMALNTGDAGVHNSNGDGFIGGKAHETVRSAARRFIQSLERHGDALAGITPPPVPSADSIRFYALSRNGLLGSGEIPREALVSETHPLSPCFRAAHDVLTQLRLIDAGMMRVVVCSLGDRPVLARQAEQDAEIYRKHFSSVRRLEAGKLTDLLAIVKSERVDIVHLVNDFAEDGSLVESGETRARIESLFELCRTKELLFIYLAGDIPADHRTAVIQRMGSTRGRYRFSLITTLDRGAEFSPFFDRLLAESSHGRLLGNAWLKLRPQDAGKDAPRPEVDPGPHALLVLTPATLVLKENEWDAFRKPA